MYEVTHKRNTKIRVKSPRAELDREFEKTHYALRFSSVRWPDVIKNEVRVQKLNKSARIPKSAWNAWKSKQPKYTFIPIKSAVCPHCSRPITRFDKIRARAESNGHCFYKCPNPKCKRIVSDQYIDPSGHVRSC